MLKDLCLACHHKDSSHFENNKMLIYCDFLVLEITLVEPCQFLIPISHFLGRIIQI